MYVKEKKEGIMPKYRSLSDMERDYDLTNGKRPAWMDDPSLLPKRPPQRIQKEEK